MKLAKLTIKQLEVLAVAKHGKTAYFMCQNWRRKQDWIDVIKAERNIDRELNNEAWAMQIQQQLGAKQ